MAHGNGGAEATVSSGNGAPDRLETTLRGECPGYRQCSEGTHDSAAGHLHREAQGSQEPAPRTPRYIWAVIAAAFLGAAGVILGAIAVTAR